MRTNTELRRLSTSDLIGEVRRLEHLLEQQMTAAPGVGDIITVQGVVSSSTGKPLVQMRSGEAAWQFSPVQARQHALIVIDAAVESELDAATVAFMRSNVGGGADEAAGFLLGIREHRTDWLAQMREGR